MSRELRFVLLALILSMFVGSCTPRPPRDVRSTLMPYTKTSDPFACVNVIETAATFEYQTPMNQDFTGTLQVSGLIPDHLYAFTLNGWKDLFKPGNDKLIDTCGATKDGQGYCDFPVHSDEEGNINKRVSLTLPEGKYQIKFLLKDFSGAGYCVLLYDDSPPTFKMIDK